MTSFECMTFDAEWGIAFFFYIFDVVSSRLLILLLSKGLQCP